MAASSDIRVEVEPRMVRKGEPVECGFINFLDGDRLITRLAFTREQGVQDWFRDSDNKSKTNRKEIAGFYLDLAYEALNDAGIDIPRLASS